MGKVFGTKEQRSFALSGARILLWLATEDPKERESPFSEEKQSQVQHRAAGVRAAPLSDRSRNKTGGKNDLKIKGPLKLMFPGACVCVSFHEEGI